MVNTVLLAIFAVLFVLKAVGLLLISWWFVFAPLFLLLVLWIMALVILCAAGAVVSVALLNAFTKVRR